MSNQRIHTVSVVLLGLLLCGAAGCTGALRESGREARRPNVLLILADDLGYSDIGSYGSEIRTPNLDRLAREGVRFSRFYNTARCSPSRASLLTGLYPHKAGVGFLTSRWAQQIRDTLGAPGYLDHLSPNSVTLAEVLKTSGYRTYMAGKWHVGQERPHWPVDRGFDESLVVLEGYDYFQPARCEWARNGERFAPDSSGFYTTDALTDEAVHFLQGHPENEPFFLYLAYTAPHWPLHAPEADIARYEGRYMAGWDTVRSHRYERLRQAGLIGPESALSPPHPEAPRWETLSAEEKRHWDRRMAVYAAQIEIMDEGIGRVLKALRQRGVLDDTIVLFLSDNGGSAEPIDRGDPDMLPGRPGSFLSYGLPWANVSNTPFRLFKQWVHEGGISTPFIMRWPNGGVGPEGGIVRAEGHLVDVMATLVEATGSRYPSERAGTPVAPMQGRSLLQPARGNPTAEPRPLFWEHQGHRAAYLPPWKLVSEYGRPWELYDMRTDRSELNDRASGYPERVRSMEAAYLKWAKDNGVTPWERTGR